MNKFGKLKVLTLFAIILFSFSDTVFSSTVLPPKATYVFKVSGHEYNLVGNGFRYIATASPLSHNSLNRTDLFAYLNSMGSDCLKELKRLIILQDKKPVTYLVSRSLSVLKQHMLLHGHMGYYKVFSSYEGIISSLQPRGIFNINLECKKRIAFDQHRKLGDMLTTLQRDRDQASIIDLPNLLPLSVTTRFFLSEPKGYSSLDPLFRGGGVNTDLIPRPSAGAKSLEQISEGIINWIFSQTVTLPVFTVDPTDNTKFSLKVTLPPAAAETDLIPGVISGEHIGNVKKRAGFVNTDNVLIGVQLTNDGEIIITSLYPVE